MNKAILVDLDHTLIRPLGERTFPVDKDDWEFIDKNIDYIKNLCDLDSYSVHIVSNQGGIQSGYVTEEEINQKLSSIIFKLKERGIPILSGLYCPFLEDFDRKPSPGLAYTLAVQYQLHLKECIMVGDMESDRDFAENAGIGKYVDVKDI